MSDTNNCNKESLDPSALSSQLSALARLEFRKVLNTYSELDWLVQSSVRNNVLSHQFPVSPGVEEDGVAHLELPGLAGLLRVVDDELAVREFYH